MPKARKESILIVDDSPNTLELLRRNIEAIGHRVFTAENVYEALKTLEAEAIDLVITDMKMPGASGMELIKHVRENFKEIEIMMITGYATVEGAVEAVKAGAEEYLSKPFTEEELTAAIGRAIEKLKRRRLSLDMRREILPAPQGLIGVSEPMNSVYSIIAKASETDATVLISGESGTGKELIARAIHYGSSRASAPFVAVNCGGIPEGLLESELFGYVKGAFTGAFETRKGFFETANGGSIFLDEIGEASLSMQVKLLRVLQSKEFIMVGGNKTRKVDVRVLAATNKDLPGLVKTGKFREDLFFRLNVINISVPPARERREDLPLLLNHFLAKYSREMGKERLAFSEEALNALIRYYWPGNVREIENAVQRLVVMAEGELISVSELPSHMRFSALREAGFNRSLAEAEAEYIKNVLASVGGNKSQAAAILGIDRKTLREKLKKYGA